jgi:hypothetical protein
LVAGDDAGPMASSNALASTQAYMSPEQLTLRRSSGTKDDLSGVQTCPV